MVCKGEELMAYVKVRDGEHLEAALKRFNRKVESERIIKDFKERQYFVKPSKKRRLKKKEAERKQHIKNLKQSKNDSRHR